MALPTHVDFLSNLTFVSTPTEEDCPICIAPYDAQAAGNMQETTHSAVQTPCGHVHGESCLKAWLDSSTTCPTCRRVLYEAEKVEQEEGFTTPERTRALGFGEEVNDDWIGLASRGSLTNDSENRAHLAALFAARERAMAHRDQARVVLLESQITTTWSSRLDLYLSGHLTINNAEFRNRPFARGAVTKNPHTPRTQRFTVDSEAIEKRIRWYLNRTLESAAQDNKIFTDEPVGMALHPMTLCLAEYAISMVRRGHGMMSSAKGMRREMRRWLEPQLEDEGLWGLETIMWDLAEVAALTLCGLPVEIHTLAFHWETYREA